MNKVKNLFNNNKFWYYWNLSFGSLFAGFALGNFYLGRWGFGICYVILSLFMFYLLWVNIVNAGIMKRNRQRDEEFDKKITSDEPLSYEEVNDYLDSLEYSTWKPWRVKA